MYSFYLLNRITEVWEPLWTVPQLLKLRKWKLRGVKYLIEKTQQAKD